MSTSQPKSKPRPIASCSFCRSRKVKCDRLSPCSTCITRGAAHECIYTTTDEDRQAIAQAEMITELRATRNRLRGQLAGQHNQSQSQSQGQGQGQGQQCVQRNEMAELEAVYLGLKGGSWDVAQQLVERIRSGESVREMARGETMD